VCGFVRCEIKRGKRTKNIGRPARLTERPGADRERSQRSGCIGGVQRQPVWSGGPWEKADNERKGELGTNRWAGGPRQRQEAIPTLATVPKPQNATGSVGGSPGEWNTKMGGTVERIPGGKGGFDEKNCFFPRLQAPAGRWRRCRAQRKAHISPSKGWTRCSGPVVGRVCGGEHNLSIYLLS